MKMHHDHRLKHVPAYARRSSYHVYPSIQPRGFSLSNVPLARRVLSILTLSHGTARPRV